MIFFKPVPSCENNIVDFEGLENDVCYGKCRLIIEGQKAVIESISFDKTKPYICEGLIKSAFNYACLKNCYMGYVTFDIPSFLLDKMDFQNKNGIYFNDIPSILQGKCCKNK